MSTLPIDQKLHRHLFRIMEWRRFDEARGMTPIFDFGTQGLELNLR